MPSPFNSSSTSSERLGIRGLLATVLNRGWASKAEPRRGRLLLESLEPRQMMAGDVDLWATDGFEADETPASESTSASALTVTTQAEGESAPDLVQFAKDLEAAGVKFFGAHWCPACTQQKQLFGDGGDDLPFIEVTSSDRTLNQVGINEGISQYPTWEFPDNTREIGVLDLATLSSRSGVPIPQSEDPTFEAIGSQTVRIGSPLHIPVDAYDPDGGPLTVTVSVEDPSLLEATVISGNRSLRLDMEGFGDMVFELFEQRAPDPAGRVADLAESGFYDGIIFHRVIDNFVIQAGDPTGTGTSGSSLGQFDDQFHPELQHNRSGILSFAKTADDTNNSQFFVTEVPTRHLDFNHSIFGQLVEGEDVREAISNMEVDGADKPTTPITISSASVFTDTENSVVMLKPLNGTGQTTVTITVTDEEGNSHSEVVPVEIVADNANSQPFLDEVTDPDPVPAGTTAGLQLSSIDVEGDPVNYFADLQSNSTTATVSVDSSSGLVSVTPANGFTGDVQVLVGVEAATAATSASDTQLVTFTFEGEQNQPAAPTSLNLTSSSDSGFSSTDNVTNAGTLTFTVTGVTSGNVVQIVNTADNSVVGQANATGSTTTITTTTLASLGDGTYALAARQSDGTETSGLSPTLSVTFDSTEPTSAIASITSQANVGRDIDVDLSHPDEGNGLVYSFSAAPSGASISPGTGEIQWTPTEAQIGDRTFTLELTDRAGNVRTESFVVSVAQTPLAEIDLEVTDLQGNPIQSVEAGQEFLLRMYGVDSRPEADRLGIFAAYADILYDSNLVRAVGGSPIEYASGFGISQSGTVSSGLINELGAATTALSPTDQERSLVASVRMEAISTGSVNFRSESADADDSTVLLYLRNNEVDPSQIIYGTEALAIGQAYVLIDDVLNISEDSGSHTIDVLVNDNVFSSSNSLSILSVTQPNEGGTSALDNGTVSFTPDPDFFGSTTFTYRVSDTNGVESIGTVTVTVANVNDPPTGVADTFEVDEGTVLNPLDVLANDNSSPDANETLKIIDASASANGGTVTVTDDGNSIEYTPPSGFTGTDTFTYTLSDGELTSQVNVDVTVAPADPPPTANPDSFNVTEDDSEAEFDILSNDTSDASNESFVIDTVGEPSEGGAARVSDDGTQFFYTPAPNFNGTEEVRYTIRDTGGGLALSTVTFTVAAENDPPPASNQTTTVNRADGERRVLRLDDLPANVDAGESLLFSSVGSTQAGGSVRINADETAIFYTAPSNDFVGDDSFTYTVRDSEGAESTATLTVSVVDFPRRAFTIKQNGSGVAGYVRDAVTLTGNDVLGNPVELSLTAGSESAEFEDLLPGNYTLHIPAIPFLQNAAESRAIAINSEPDDGDVEVNIDIGRLRPEYVSIRDWLGSTDQKSILAAVAPGQSALFTIPTTAVDEVNDPVVEMDNRGLGLTIRGKNDSDNNIRARVPVHGNRDVQSRGQFGEFRLLRIGLGSNNVTFDEDSTAASTQSVTSASGTQSTSAAEAASGSLTVGNAAEGESSVLQSITRADLITPLHLDEAAPTASVDEAVARSATKASPLTSNGSSIDQAMSDVGDKMTVRSGTADSLAERGLFASALQKDLIDAAISDEQG